MNVDLFFLSFFFALLFFLLLHTCAQRRHKVVRIATAKILLDMLYPVHRDVVRAGFDPAGPTLQRILAHIGHVEQRLRRYEEYDVIKHYRQIHGFHAEDLPNPTPRVYPLLSELSLCQWHTEWGFLGVKVSLNESLRHFCVNPSMRDLLYYARYPVFESVYARVEDKQQAIIKLEVTMRPPCFTVALRIIQSLKDALTVTASARNALTIRFMLDDVEAFDFERKGSYAAFARLWFAQMDTLLQVFCLFLCVFLRPIL